MTAYETDAYNSILYNVFSSAEFAKGCGGDHSSEQIRKWCNNLNRRFAIRSELIDDIVLEIEARLSPAPNPKLLNIMARDVFR